MINVALEELLPTIPARGGSTYTRRGTGAGVEE